jgi:nicotinate-nucleotide adenylyltransferase
MNVALFGGTFDPIHRGHLAVARAAQERFQLKLIYFVPNGAPPHRANEPIVDFEHRYAMVTLATQGEKTFVPSLLEAPRPTNVLRFRTADDKPDHPRNYSIDTVHRLQRTLQRSDKLYFIVGIDAFLQIASWKDPEALLSETEFIIAARPGFSLADVAGALPPSLQPKAAAGKPVAKHPARGTLVLPGVTANSGGCCRKAQAGGVRRRGRRRLHPQARALSRGCDAEGAVAPNGGKPLSAACLLNC